MAARRTGDQGLPAIRPPTLGAQRLSRDSVAGPQTPLNHRANSVFNPAEVTTAQNVVVVQPRPSGIYGQKLDDQPTDRAQVSSLRQLQRDISAGPAVARPVPQLPNHQQSTIINNTISDDTLRSDASGTTEHEPPIGFFTARDASVVQNAAALPPNISVFNPHLESPSIRKTAGIDHTKTKPVGREVVGGPPVAVQVTPLNRSNFVNPQADQARRIGMPGGAASPLQNRSSYKPPQMMKRPADTIGVQ